MTTQLPSKERMEHIANFHRAMTLPPSHDEIEAMARALLAAYEQEPVAIVELSDYVTAAQLSGDEPRKKAAKELYEGALVVGQVLYANPAPSIPAVPDDVKAAIVKLKNTLVACNRYGYCADAVKSIENACRAAMLNGGK